MQTISTLVEPYQTNFRKKLELYEARVPWMYLDAAGNVTCGIGHMAATARDAANLPWNGGDPIAAWQAVRSAKPNLRAQEYEGLTTCRLGDAEMDHICARDVEATGAQIAAFLPSFDNLPQPVRQALLDMAFNLGAARLHKEYFGAGCHFGPAILRGDWNTAAAHSVRLGIQDERNRYTSDLILSAGPSKSV